MRPALSVLLLTTLIGAGQGLFLVVYAIYLGADLGRLSAPPDGFFLASGVLALALLGGGLFASFFHLGRPERAWRAAAQWRTSWLSREVIVLPAFMALVFLFTLAFHPAGAWLRPLLPWLGALGALASLALFVCTGMIYACVRFLQEWASPLTVVNFILLGCASGATLAAPLVAVAARDLLPSCVAAAAVLTLLAFFGRAAAHVRSVRLRPKSTPATAIGIKHPKIAQQAAGFLGGSFNTREFFHGRGAGFLRLLRWTYVALGFAVPFVLLVSGLQAGSVALLAAAFAAQYAGLLAERWIFFAEASHPQNLYYQAIA